MFQSRRYTQHSCYFKEHIFSIHSVSLGMLKASQMVGHTRASQELSLLFQAFSRKPVSLARFSKRFHEHRSQARREGLFP
jgi:hypothetical protein